MFAGYAFAEEVDQEGCHDLSLVKRFPGSVIVGCDSKDFDQQEFPIGHDADGNVKNKVLEGKVERVTYSHGAKTSALEVTRNYTNALKKVGFTIVASDGGIFSAKAVKGSAETWALVNSGINGEVLQTNIAVMQVQAMEQKVEANAASLLESINTSGRVAVYGINFDSNKAVVRPDSEAVLGEILKLMQENADLNLKVEGHTDNVGAAKANLKLSKERAAAVKAWLVKHGIATARLTTDGFGDTKPIGDNSTEDGRAKNRRVELVKF